MIKLKLRVKVKVELKVNQNENVLVLADYKFLRNLTVTHTDNESITIFMGVYVIKG